MTARTFARMLGVRDLALGLAIAATAHDAEAHRRTLQIAGLVDVGDVLSIAVAGARPGPMRAALLRNLPFAGGSAVASFVTATTVR